MILVNHFLANVPILYPLEKTRKDQRFSGVFRRLKIATLARNKLKVLRNISRRILFPVPRLTAIEKEIKQIRRVFSQTSKMELFTKIVNPFMHNVKWPSQADQKRSCLTLLWMHLCRLLGSKIQWKKLCKNSEVKRIIISSGKIAVLSEQEQHHPAGIYLFKSTMKTPEQCMKYVSI